jgi:hypothetical protein
VAAIRNADDRGQCLAFDQSRDHKLQISLFTRLSIAEAELRAIKDTLAELKVNHDELRRDRDEWRWRAERLLADQQRGFWGRWSKRADAALDAVTAIFCGLLAEAQKSSQK